MRSFAAALLAGVLMAGTLVFQAQAGGNVLLPSSNGNASNGPSLGLTPAAPAPSSSSQPAAPAPLLPPAQSSTALPYTPAPAATPGLTSAQMPSGSSMQAPSLASMTQTKVIQIPAYPTIPPQQLNLPNGISIDMGTQWNPADVKRISDQLGIPADKVPSVCQIGLSGGVMSDKGAVPFDSGTSQHAAVRYDGKVTSLMILTRAFCNMSYPLPPNKGVIFQVGDKYFVNIATTRCQPGSNPTPTQATIGDDTTGMLQCQLQ